MTRQEVKKQLDEIIVHIIKIIKPEDAIEHEYDAFMKLYGTQVIVDCLGIMSEDLRKSYVSELNNAEDPLPIMQRVINEFEDSAIEGIYIRSLQRIVEIYVDGNNDSNTLSQDQLNKLKDVENLLKDLAENV